MNERTVRAGEWSRRTLGTITAGLVILSAMMGGRAYAGGFEAPGLGTEAMGRGGAFTAKASDGSALEYNIAGLARQRGWRLLIDGKLVLNSHEFTRAGVYPGAIDPMRPWQGQPYPTVSNSHGLSGAPMVVLSTDFNYFDRWTFAIGLTTPSASDSNRSFPTTVNGNWPAPQRYDIHNVNLLVVYPMLAAAVRVTKWLDIGLAVQMVYGHFDLTATAFADLGAATCADPTQCDSLLNIRTKGITATGALGLMVHPLKNLHLGLHVRGPIYLNTSGDVTATQPGAITQPLDPGDPGIPGDPNRPAKPAAASLPFRLPWVVRLGLRYAFMKDAQREQGDIEINGTYESWKEAQGVGDKLSVPSLGPFVDITATLVHRYKDTGSVRVGGAYNHWFANNTVLTIRAGVFFDSAAAEGAWTRLDFDTLTKIGGSLGLGYRIRGVGINAGYTYIGSPSVTITEGRQQVINGTNGTTWRTDNTGPLPIINNGTFSASTHLILVGLNFAFDELMKRQRVLKYD